MVNDIISTKYTSILRIISLNTSKSKFNVQSDFLRFYDGVEYIIGLKHV